MDIRRCVGRGESINCTYGYWNLARIGQVLFELCPSIAPTGIETFVGYARYFERQTINCTYGYWNSSDANFRVSTGDHQLHLRVLKHTPAISWAEHDTPSIAPTGIETCGLSWVIGCRRFHQLHLRVLKPLWVELSLRHSSCHQLHLRVLKLVQLNIPNPYLISINCTYGYWNQYAQFHPRYFATTINCTYGYWNKQQGSF